MTTRHNSRMNKMDRMDIVRQQLTQHEKEKEKEKLERLDLVELQLDQIQQALQQTPSIATKSQQSRHSSQQQQVKVAGIQRLSIVAGTTDSGGLNIPTEHYIKEKLSYGPSDYEDELQTEETLSEWNKIMNYPMDKLLQLVVNVLDVQKYYLNQILLV